MTEEFQKNKEKAKELRKQLDEIQESLTNAVIIDGVNVAGCSEFLEPDGCDDTDCASFQCDRNTNCYYKQLNRLEQENEELLETLTKGCYQNLQHECRIWELKESNYRSALEEIQKAIKSYDLVVDNGASVDTLYTIRKIINEVLN